MTFLKTLYFITIIPDPILCGRIRQLKEELRDKYGVSHALKLPAHVTLQIPFDMNPRQESKLEGLLSSFSEHHKAFPVKINGFGAFKPRVIYLKVEDHSPFVELHKDLQPLLAEELELLEREVTSKIHPHFTVATRDLKNAVFKEAWPQLKDREFKAEFIAQKISLLKHNGKTWDILKEFPLNQ